MLNLFLTAFVTAFLAAGVRRPFLFVLAYAYIDIVAPQKVTWGFLAHVPVSLIAFICAVTAWVVAENKNGIRFSPRQFLLLMLLVYCGLTTRTADFPEEALEKWGWVWKALIFALFLPLTVRTRLRIEALVLIMVLSVGVIVIGGGIKTLAGGGGYGELKLLVNDNTGIYEGSTLSTVAVATIPLIVWLARFGTIFPPGRLVGLFALGLAFACCLIPVGTQTRTGLICLVILAALSLRSVKRPLLYIGIVAGLATAAIPLLPESYVARMNTIENHKSDQSASTRVAVWMWTLDFVKTHPFGGGFDAFRQNRVSYDRIEADTAGDNNTAIKTQRIEEKARAYHSAYFEMLGEQGWPGFGMWLLLHLSGLFQLELIQRRLRRDTDVISRSDRSLALALQSGHCVYMFGALFVGIAFQPFIFMLIGLQIALAMQVARRRAPPSLWQLRAAQGANARSGSGAVGEGVLRGPSAR
ncbi:putative O-glycosylation ligase, exosortase A system-associated [Novosphingobium sp. PASSN1]|uniref:putative O-glycosylation ligase, exosortase A system-associated n=1 Tax=Novosphingobium sp. PASSN1 TaxID=2015561 RepID=UPI000BDAA1EA|nr:putative O-glycosylation ligase, exosortase A system-associated [Novosphingobium sp. PASSN1]OYU33249.1 MAG: putative O-glycosylation ligase, exosortase A system-associated [Novosphingobium sp. PASSN1]